MENGVGKMEILDFNEENNLFELIEGSDKNWIIGFQKTQQKEYKIDQKLFHLVYARVLQHNTFELFE